MRKLVPLLSVAALVLSCGPPQLPTGPKVTPPGSGEGGKYQCKDVTGSTDPWLVEWDPTAKVRLQSKAKKGVLLVKYAGCNLEVLYGCEVEGKYEFTATTRSSQTEYINNEDELFAKLPIGALNLVSQFNQGDRWALDYVVVGTRDANVNQVERTDLSGRCAEATHFVQGMAVGAYQLGSEAHRKGGAEATLYGVGAGGSSGSAAGNLRQDGHYQKCVGDETDANSPDCQAVVQLYLEPIAGAILTPVAVTVSAPISSEKAEPKSTVGSASPSPNLNDEVQQPGTNLYWLRCPVGQIWDGYSCSGSKKRMSWKSAKSACPSGYRLPTRQEIVDLLGGCDSEVRIGKAGPCKKCSDSSNCRSMFSSDRSWYWLSSSYVSNPDFAWGVDFNHGFVGSVFATSGHNARCVRTGP